MAGYLEERRKQVDEALDRLLPREDEPPAKLHQAMRYSVFGGGKRLRPILCLACAAAAGGDPRRALAPAAAIECLHTYTLIHDDLPSMDDDALRRGRPTAHIAFGEANAILAGDSLLTLAFEILAWETAPAPYAPGQLIHELASASGSRGVAGGQYEDLSAENGAPDEARLTAIHLNKTAKLIRAACRIGAVSAGASAGALEAFSLYGENAGLAFQVADDILNVTSTPEQLGKAVGSDAAHGKLTCVSLHGLDGARRRGDELVDRAIRALAVFDAAAEPLRAIARFIMDRRT